MARYTSYIRQRPDGWEWSKTLDAVSWWGSYQTEGQAKSAAKRVISKVIGRINPADFAFIQA